MKPTYDDHQLSAVLTICFVCCRYFYMTKPGPVCIRCQKVEAA